VKGVQRKAVWRVPSAPFLPTPTCTPPVWIQSAPLEWALIGDTMTRKDLFDTSYTGDNESPSGDTAGALKDAPVQSLTMKQTMQAAAIKGSR